MCVPEHIFIEPCVLYWKTLRALKAQHFANEKKRIALQSEFIRHGRKSHVLDLRWTVDTPAQTSAVKGVGGNTVFLVCSHFSTTAKLFLEPPARSSTFLKDAPSPLAKTFSRRQR